MQRTHLAGSGIEVSRLCMGTMTFGGQADEAESHRMLDACLEGGIDFFDTANMYNAGRSEEILGSWLAARRGLRERIVLAGKVRYPVGDDLSTIGLSRRNILRQLDRSLARLRTDHLDIYYLHAPDDHTAIDETLHAMETLVRSGRVRTAGMSNYAAWQMADAWWRCDHHGWAKPTVVQPMYNLIARDIEVEILPFCRRFELATCVYNPLAGGLLTGKHRKGDEPENSGRFGSNVHYRRRYWHAAHFDAVAELASFAQAGGRSLIGMSLRWLLDQAIDCVILGASSMAQLEADLAALAELDGAALDSEMAARCDATYRRLRGEPPVIVR